MQVINNIKSIRRSIVLSLLGFVFVFVSLAIFYLANTFSEQSKHQISQNIVQWSNYISRVTAADLAQGNTNGLSLTLESFNANRDIEQIDLYQRGQGDSYNWLASRTQTNNDEKRGLSKTLTELEKNGLTAPVFQQQIVSYSFPITYNDTQVGFGYIEMKPKTGLGYSGQVVLMIAILLFILFTAMLIVSVRLENTISTPLKALSGELLAISQSKDYAIRVNSQPYREADHLARNINNFLNRTERHITQLGLAEQQSLKLNIELEDKVNKRTQALKESNQELLSTLEKLHQFQDQLVESEKMASLGDMVAGVAHEVNTPIGLGVTASTLLSDRLDEIKEAFENKSLKSSQLKKFLTEGEENVGIVYRNLKRAAELISSFKKVAVDQSSDDFRQFNFAELLNEILLTLAPQIKKTPYQIDFDCPSDLLIVSKPGPINQIMINLILNSITHGFDNRDHGSISVKIMRLGEQLHIHYQDDGIGIDPAIKDKIFDPFTTTKRGEGGSGLGLHLVYNLVTQALGGSIRLESEQGKGATFEISFPISEQLL